MPTEPAQPTTDPLLLAAIDAVRRAGALCKHLQARLEGQGVSKTDGSPVTIADYAAQALITRALIEHGVDAAIAGEEQADTLRQSPQLLAQVTRALQETIAWPEATPARVLDMIAHRAWRDDALPDRAWVIDPIDGTKGFIAQRHFAVCLALIERGRPTVAALACPNLSLALDADPMLIDPRGMVIACAATGPILEGPLLSTAGALSNAPLTPAPARHALPRQQPIMTFSVEASEGRVRDFEALADEMQRATGRRPVPLALDSQAKYALVARGQADVYDRPPRHNSEKTWDHAPGCLLLERAGCTVTDAHGAALDWSHVSLRRTRGILGAPPDLHAAVLAARRATGAV